MHMTEMVSTEVIALPDIFYDDIKTRQRVLNKQVSSFNMLICTTTIHNRGQRAEITRSLVSGGVV